MTREEYRAHPALNFSLAKWLLKSPAHFKAAVDEEQEETDAMRVGTLAHAMVLEGKDLRDLYAIKPEGMSFATKEGKAWRDSQTLPILKEEDANAIPMMAQSIARNADAASILMGCQMRERPIFFTLHGVECKALLDACGTDGEAWAICDFKKVRDASVHRFERAIQDFDYDMQAAWYSDGLAMAEGIEEQPWYSWITCEDKAPHWCPVYAPDDEVMSRGRAKVEKALSIYKDCMASGKWPMPSQGVSRIGLPKWVEPIEQPAPASHE